MKVTINGTEEIIKNDSMTVDELLKLRKVKMPDMVSVELNDVFLDRKTFSTTKIKEGDKIEFLYFLGGGKF